MPNVGIICRFRAPGIGKCLGSQKIAVLSFPWSRHPRTPWILMRLSGACRWRGLGVPRVLLQCRPLSGSFVHGWQPGARQLGMASSMADSESLTEMPNVLLAKQKAASKTLKRPAPYDGHPTPYWRRLGPMHRAGCSLGWRGSLSVEGSSEPHEQCVLPQCELLVLLSYAVI